MAQAPSRTDDVYDRSQSTDQIPTWHFSDAEILIDQLRHQVFGVPRALQNL